MTSPGSSRHRILQGMLWVAGFVVLAKLAGAAKEMVVAAKFGTSALIDQYLLAFNLANLPVSLTLSVVSIVLVPLSIRLKQGPVAQLRLFRSELVGVAALVASAIAVGTWWLAPHIMRWSGVSGDGALLAPLWLIVPVGVLASISSSWLMAGERHINTLLEATPSVLLLLTLFLLGASANTLIWGTVVGFVLQLTILVWLLRASDEFEWPRVGFQAEGWNAFAKGFGIMLLGQVAMACMPVIDQLFAAQLGAGAISSLGYSNRLLSLMLGLGATALSRASLPVLARLASAEDREGLPVMINKWVLALIGLGGLTVAAGWCLAPLGVRLLFERGAFRPEDTLVVTEIFRWSLFQLPFYLSGIFIVAALAALERHGAIAMVSIGMLGLKFLANEILVNRFGLIGLVSASAVMYAFSCIACYLFLRFMREM